MNEIMEMGGRLEMFEDQRIPHEAELEELEKRMRLMRLKMLLLARAGSSNSLKKQKNEEKSLSLGCSSCPQLFGDWGEI